MRTTSLRTFAAGACCAFAIGCGSSSSNNTSNPDAAAPTIDAGAPVALTGHVYGNGGGTTGLAGATVSIAGASPAITTTSGADGSYTLMVGSNQTVFVRAAMSTYLSEQVGVVVGASGATADLVPIPMTDVNMAATEVGITFDQAKGEIEVELVSSGTAVDGFGVTVAAAHDASFTCGDNNACAAATTVSDDSGLVFPNVVTGNTTVTVTAPTGHSCTPDVSGITDYRVDAFVLTSVVLTCT